MATNDMKDTATKAEVRGMEGRVNGKFKTLFERLDAQKDLTVLLERHREDNAEIRVLMKEISHRMTGDSSRLDVLWDAADAAAAEPEPPAQPDDTWMRAYDIALPAEASPEDATRAAHNRDLAASASQGENPDKLAALVRCRPLPQVIVLAFAMEENLNLLGLHWDAERPEAMTPDWQYILRWETLLSFCKAYVGQNGAEDPMQVVIDVVRELLRMRALTLHDGRIGVNVAVRRLLIRAAGL